MKRKSIIEGLSIFVALILVILASGCATTRMYTGEALPEEQIAVVRGSSKTYFFYGTVVVRIRGVDNESVNYTSRSGAFQRVEVLPGRHKILVAISRVKARGAPVIGITSISEVSLGGRELELNVEAGHKYKIVAKKTWWKKDGYIAIVDTNAGEVISRNPLGPRF